MPKSYDDELLRSHDKSKKDIEMYGSNKDKMTFFLLKWVFNAIKKDSLIEDPKLKGKSYVSKTDLVKQLVKNDELMQALGYDDPSDVTDDVRKCMSAKDGCLTWEEFLGFFFKDYDRFTGTLIKDDANHKSQDNKENKDIKQVASPPRYGKRAEPAV
jgi:hypothetical protein